MAGVGKPRTSEGVGWDVNDRSEENVAKHGQKLV